MECAVKTDNTAKGDDRVFRPGKKAPWGLLFSAFGAGLLLALCFPTKFMLFLLALLLVVLGVISCLR